jgi:hypothetical protein
VARTAAMRPPVRLFSDPVATVLPTSRTQPPPSTRPHARRRNAGRGRHGRGARQRRSQRCSGSCGRLRLG